MNCVLRNCVCSLVLVVACVLSAIGKNSIGANEANSSDHFQWQEHTHLSWDDFKGVVNAPHDESAAATYCSIGFKTNTPAPGAKPEIVVYNSFYINRSWVREDAKIQSILDHEQGHFDLCEIYTRKLKSMVAHFDLDSPGAKNVLMDIYAQVSSEYETRQQAYELETTHGTNLAEQRRWQRIIGSELM